MAYQLLLAVFAQRCLGGTCCPPQCCQQESMGRDGSMLGHGWGSDPSFAPHMQGGEGDEQAQDGTVLSSTEGQLTPGYRARLGAHVSPWERGRTALEQGLPIPEPCAWCPT